MEIKSTLRKARAIAIRLLTVGKPLLPLPDVAFVFAPHPDDEVFGCCGLMQGMLAKGKRVELFVLSGGSKSLSCYCGIDEAGLIAIRRQLTRNAAVTYGLGEGHIHFLNYPDSGIRMEHPETGVLATTLAELLATIPGDVCMFIPHRSGEGWSDHTETARIVMNLIPTIPTRTRINVYEYCVWFWFYNSWRIAWRNVHVLKMSEKEHILKLRAIKSYMEPKAPCGSPYSGIQPKVFTWANSWDKELYFRV